MIVVFYLVCAYVGLPGSWNPPTSNQFGGGASARAGVACCSKCLPPYVLRCVSRENVRRFLGRPGLMSISKCGPSDVYVDAGVIIYYDLDERVVRVTSIVSVR
jgi:hypothetical protein